jgi:hypothetical protein
MNAPRGRQQLLGRVDFVRLGFRGIDQRDEGGAVCAGLLGCEAINHGNAELRSKRCVDGVSELR